jgi:aminodeoxyfutalosine deaminase
LTEIDSTVSRPVPKIELHVHLEGTIQAHTLMTVARRNALPLPADTVEGLTDLYRFRDFQHFIEVWVLTTNCLRTADDFRQVVVDYAAAAASHGAVYLEGIFSPAERVARGVSWDALFSGYCDGAQQAEEEHGVVVRLTPDVHWGIESDDACEVARRAVAFRDRGVVGLGVGGLEGKVAPGHYARAFAIARDGGLGSVPHAGEVGGAVSVRDALQVLGADRIRHGIRAVEDPGLVAELADRGTVLDVCPTSNLRTGVVASLDRHPMGALVAAGVNCSVSTDDPAMFDTDLSREYALLGRLGTSPQLAYEAGVSGALCDDDTRATLRSIAELTSWSGAYPFAAGHEVTP